MLRPAAERKMQSPALHSALLEQSWSSPALQTLRQRVPPTKREFWNFVRSHPGQSLLPEGIGFPSVLPIMQQTPPVPGQCEASVQCHSVPPSPWNVGLHVPSVKPLPFTVPLMQSEGAKPPSEKRPS